MKSILKRIYALEKLYRFAADKVYFVQLKSLSYQKYIAWQHSTHGLISLFISFYIRPPWP